eukprot:scaffold307_cov146-Skeletonema_menzelii.AAC.1
MKAQLKVVVEEYRSRLQREEERGERDTVSIYEGVIPSSLRYLLICTYAAALFWEITQHASASTITE